MVTWEAARIKRSFREFIGQKCVKKGNKALNADAENFDETQLDEEKMESRILDLIAALGVVRERRRQAKRTLLTSSGQPMSPEMESVRNKVFRTMVISFLDENVINKGIKLRGAVEMVMRAFPDASKLTDGRGWLPLHWSAASVASEENQQVNKVTNMKVLYDIDPMALQRYHLKGTGANNMGYTPAHMLCMQGTTNRIMALVQHGSICNSEAFTMSASYPNIGDPLHYGFSALHIACWGSHSKEELHRHLLQLDSSQTKKKCSENGFTPLGYLCIYNICSYRLITCLLDVDSSVEVVGNGIFGCLSSHYYTHVLARVEMLLKANPEAAKYRDSGGLNLLHIAASRRMLPFQPCIDVIQRILVTHKDAVREVTSQGWLPVHHAAHSISVEVMEFLLSLYPESASMVTTDGSYNLLHLAVCDKEDTTSVMKAKVRFLCTRYPALMLQRDGSGNTPLLNAIYFENILAMQLLCEAGGQAQVRVPVAHPTYANYGHNGRLPLHFLIDRQAGPLSDSLLSKEADYFRLFLRWYPEAAGIEGGVGAVYKKTPYQLAVDISLPPYYLRLLLRAAPNLNPAELHRLNYAERRMAIFLAFKAVTSIGRPTLLAKLLRDNRDTLHDVMSFL